MHSREAVLGLITTPPGKLDTKRDHYLSTLLDTPWKDSKIVPFDEAFANEAFTIYDLPQVRTIGLPAIRQIRLSKADTSIQSHTETVDDEKKKKVKFIFGIIQSSPVPGLLTSETCRRNESESKKRVFKNCY